MKIYYIYVFVVVVVFFLFIECLLYNLHIAPFGP